MGTYEGCKMAVFGGVRLYCLASFILLTELEPQFGQVLSSGTPGV